MPAWLVAGALSVAAAGFLSVRVLGAVPPEERRRALVVTVATTACLAFWAAFGAFGGPRAETHLLLLGLAATTLLIVAPTLTGNIRDGWGRASVVRVHMLLLLGIYVLFFMVGLTGDQTAEVLRGWGDDAWVDVCVGVAGALLLGLTIRASSRRLFTQAESTTTQATPDPAPPTGGRESTWNLTRTAAPTRVRTRPSRSGSLEAPRSLHWSCACCTSGPARSPPRSWQRPSCPPNRTP